MSSIFYNTSEFIAFLHQTLNSTARDQLIRHGVQPYLDLVAQQYKLQETPGPFDFALSPDVTISGKCESIPVHVREEVYANVFHLMRRRSK